ncbi:trehalase1 [Zea mays]|uniref:alpha,alpha-trehalase n=1 Tax=Zea mays TaxID=4577 RepID=A0A1D6K6W1_MAIZE|nr:trehalase1 [Zea mays]
MAGLPPQPQHVHALPLLLLVVLPCLIPCLRATTEMAPTAATAGASDEGASALLGLLQRVQSEALRTLGPHDFDPKFYVDLPLATDERAAAAALAALPRPSPSRAELDDFLSRYFGDPGSDLVADVPPDFEPEPRGFLPHVHSPEARAWALEVHALWKRLARRVAPDVAARPDRHTLMPLPGRAVVPGSRFREVYYWDSYWVIRGLLVSKMYDTAKTIVLNLVYLLEKYGFVPNGARSYYTNRRLFLTTFTVLFRNSTDMTTLATTYIIPVDLNTFLFKMELDIGALAKVVGDNATSEFFLNASKARHIAIDSILWNSEMEQWLDYWLPGDADCQEVHEWKPNSQNRNIFASNFVPLWLNAYHSEFVRFADEAKSNRVMASLKASGLLHAAGIATSLTNTSQQWDFPNGWAPLQHLIAEGLLHSGSEAKKLAEDIATRWVRTNYAAYKATGAMHEKYDVEACGESGGGGEYKPQTGFGWSNGVVLSFLEEFGWPEGKEIAC